MGERGFRILCIVMLVWSAITVGTAVWGLSSPGISKFTAIAAGLITICAAVIGLRVIKFGKNGRLCRIFGIILLVATVGKAVVSIGAAKQGSVSMEAIVVVLSFIFPALYIAGAKNV